MPQGYFDASATKLLTAFQQSTLAQPNEEQLAYFPETIVKTLQKTWQSSATYIYRNWLNYVLTKKTNASPFASLSGSYAGAHRKRSAVL
jgi:homoserine trans-succinylase